MDSEQIKEATQETMKLRCNHCGVTTNHLLRAQYTCFRRTADDTAVNLSALPENDRLLVTEGKLKDICRHENSIWSCAGCDIVVFEWQIMYAASAGGWDEHDGDCVSASNNSLMRPKLFTMNAELMQLYQEVLTSFKEDCLLLCTIGLRALLEGVCRDKGLRDGNLEKRIEQLIKFRAECEHYRSTTHIQVIRKTMQPMNFGP